MGNHCCPVDYNTRMIERRIREIRTNDSEVIKLLFLGAGGSGKSTLFRQLRLLHGNGLGEEERRTYKTNIYNNIVKGMKTLLEGNLSFNAREESDSESALLSKVPMCEKKLADYIDTVDNCDPITPECAVYFKQAWRDKGMQDTWSYRSKLQLQDSLKYYLENIDRIATEGYIPSKDDVMHVRIKTTGIVEEKLTMNTRPFLIVDVGGQRSERRKWLSCFSDVMGLIFVASLTAYNQFLHEDESVNRLEESLRVFGRLLNESNVFDDACIVLLLNKSDLFSEMCKETPITTLLPNYTGGTSEEEQYNYIKGLYLSQVKAKVKLSSKGSAPSIRKIFTHMTCATNTDQIRVIFNSVSQHVIKRALIQAGLIVEDLGEHET